MIVQSRMVWFILCPMFKLKIPVFIKVLLLFALPLLACAVIKNSTPAPTPVPTPNTNALVLTEAVKNTRIMLTRIARKTLNAPTATKTPRPVTPVTAQPKKKTPTPTPTTQPSNIDEIIIHAPALANNLLGETPERGLRVYLPESYTQADKHYPVVYALLDFGLETGEFSISSEELQRDVDFGLTKEMLIVVISGTNSLGGSFYVNSPVSGNWDDFIAGDVVSYIDSHYRTIPRPASRGISGFAVGGFGALNVAMRHPDVFGAVYSVSPTLFDKDSLPLSPMFAAQTTIDSVLNLLLREEPMSINDGTTDMQHAGDAQFSIAYGTTFAPNTVKPPYMDYPYYRQNGRIFRDEAIWQRWESGFGNNLDRIQQYKENLLKLTSLTLACGENAPYSWIPEGCKAFAAQLTANGIPNQLASFPKDHVPAFGQLIREFTLPFFSEKLNFTP